MIIHLRLLEDPLDGIGNYDLGNDLPVGDNNILSLDNYSEKWLVKAAIEQVKNSQLSEVIIKREGVADFQNLKPLLIMLPQLGKVNIRYFGKEHPLIERIKKFPNVEVIG